MNRITLHFIFRKIAQFTPYAEPVAGPFCSEEEAFAMWLTMSDDGGLCMGSVDIPIIDGITWH